MFVFQVGDNTFQVSADTVNSVHYQPDISSFENNTWHILLENHSYRVQLISWDSEEKVIQFQVNSRTISYQYADERDILLQKLGIDSSAAQKSSVLKAPMPGLIRKIFVKPEDTVQKGDPLLALEAMKMENMLKAPVAGVVQAVEVATMQVVEKNQVLIKFQ